MIRIHRFACAGLLLGSALALAACSSTTRTTVTGPDESTGITVSGTGEVTVPPDTGFFDVGVQVRAKTVAEARDGAARAAEAVLAAIKAAGVDAKDIQTTNIQIQPEYDYGQGGTPPVLTGYIVVNTVSVKVRKVDTLAKVIDEAIAAGGDSTVLNSVRFGLENDDAAIDQARDLAMKDAKKKADQLAVLSGMKAGEPLAIAEVLAQQPPQPFAADGLLRSLAPSTGPGTPIEVGSGKVIVNVNVRYAIAK